MNYDVTVRFKIKNVINEEDLFIFYNNNYKKAVIDCINENGLFGVAEDKYDVIDIERGDD